MHLPCPGAGEGALTPEQSERLIEAYRRVDEAKDDKHRASAHEELAFAKAAPKRPESLTTAECWLMVPVFVAAFIALMWLFWGDISRLRDESPGMLLIQVACFAGAGIATAFVRQWILNERGYGE